ncbi:Hypothetical protein R9X50_00234200 [Acrodontium crateriforme]|uniref:Integral membrane protein n=1 Tax=Acrodontium crateriforme TaxID=150365 RepID=A0AAQ3M3Q2_9PEZI|nr:Hypothetical protein R9X50_00234200 [Acrodontium crateriforme]
MRPLRYLSSTHGSALVIFIVLYLAAIRYFSIVAAPDPSSAFASLERIYERRYSLIRAAQANEYIARAEQEPQRKASSDPTICVGISTVQRPKARYFKTMMGSLLDGLSDRERSDLFIMPFIGNVDPREHLAFNETWLPNVADKIVTYDDEHVSDADRARLRHMTSGQQGHKEKALFDYKSVLRGCLKNTHAPYVLIVEDDTLAIDGWYSHTMAALRELEANRDYKTALYLRLFYNTGLQGWNSEFWPYYLFYSIIFELVFLGILISIRSMTSNPVSRFLAGRGTMAFLLCICAPACVGLFFAAGRMTVHPNPHGIHQMNHHACCSQALLFPRERVLPLLDHYTKSGIGFRDTLMEKYADDNGLSRWALTPSVFQHVGAQSSKWSGQGPKQMGRNGRTTSQNNWNFQFERWDATKLLMERIRRNGRADKDV